MVSEKDLRNSLQNYFRSEDLAGMADVIFSETLSVDDFNNRNLNAFIIHKNKDYMTYILKNFKLNDGDVIFCNSDYLEVLFKSLKNKKIKNLKLISHQSDRSIGKKIFQKMPSSIVKWYSVNVNFSDPNLIPIPLGLANKIYEKNLDPEKYSDELNHEDKIEKIYLNFNPNTNYYVRQNIIQKYENNKDFHLNIKNLRNDEYMYDLSKYKYVLCPPGNGIDTHRFWEALIAGSTPVAINSLNYNSFDNLDAVFLNNFENISIEKLNNSKKANPTDLNKFFAMLTNDIFEKRIFSNLTGVNIQVNITLLIFRKFKFYLKSKANLIYKPTRSKFLKIYFKIFK